MSSQDQTTLNQTVTPDIDSRNATQDILTTAEADGRFTTLVAAIRGAGLTGAFQDPELITVFLPSDDAIQQANTDFFTRLLHPQTRDALDALLRHHIVRGALSAADLNTTNHLRMSDGQTVKVERDGDDFLIGGARLVQTDISCTNGMIHVVDAILVPQR